MSSAHMNFDAKRHWPNVFTVVGIPHAAAFGAGLSLIESGSLRGYGSLIFLALMLFVSAFVVATYYYISEGMRGFPWKAKLPKRQRKRFGEQLFVLIIIGPLGVSTGLAFLLDPNRDGAGLLIMLTLISWYFTCFILRMFLGWLEWSGEINE